MDARRADLLVALLTGNLLIRPTTEHDTPAVGDAPTGHNPTGEDPAECTTDGCETAPCETARCESARCETARCETAERETASYEPTGCDPTTCATAGCATAGCAACEVPVGAAAPFVRADLPTPVAPAKPLVHLVIPLTTLTGADDSPVELTGYGPLPPAVARTIAADAVWKRLITDPLSGALLDHGRNTYRPPAALADYLRARDRHCRVPICRRRALDAQLDHTIGYHTHHGTTDARNLYHACLCHHRMKDAPGWSVAQHPDGRLSWTTPTGHRYSSRPFDYRPEPDLVAVIAALDRAALDRAARGNGGQAAADPPPRSPFHRLSTSVDDPGDPPPF